MLQSTWMTAFPSLGSLQETHCHGGLVLNHSLLVYLMQPVMNSPHTTHIQPYSCSQSSGNIHTLHIGTNFL